MNGTSEAPLRAVESISQAVDVSSERFQMGGVLTVGAGHAVHDTYTAFLNPLLPIFIANLALSNAQAGLLTVFIRLPSLFQPMIGHLSDRFHLRQFFILAPAASAAMMSLLGIAPNYAILALLLVATGFSSASLHAVGPAIVGRLSGRNLGRGMGFWMVGGELGRTLGPIAIVSAVQFLHLDGMPCLMIVGILASVVLWVRLKDVPGQHPSSVGQGQALPWRRALRQMGPLLPLVGVVLARVFTIASLSTYLPILLRGEGATLWFAGASLSVYEAAGVVGALLGGAISDRLGRRPILFISMLAAPLLMFVFLTVSGVVAQLLLLLALGFTALSVTPVIMALVQENSPENRALATGIYMAVNFVSSSVVVLILGALGDWFGMRTPFIVSVVVSLLGLPFVFLLPKEGLRQDTGQA